MVSTVQLSREDVAFRITKAWERKKALIEQGGGVYGLRTIARNLARLHDVPNGVDASTATRSRLRQLQRYIRAQHLPSPEYLTLLAEELGCTPEELGVELATRDAAEDGDDDEADRPMERDLVERIRAMKRQIGELERLATATR